MPFKYTQSQLGWIGGASRSQVLVLTEEIVMGFQTSLEWGKMYKRYVTDQAACSEFLAQLIEKPESPKRCES